MPLKAPYLNDPEEVRKATIQQLEDLRAARSVLDGLIAAAEATLGVKPQTGRPPNAFPQDKVIELRKRGMSWRKIAAELKVPYATVLRKITPCRGLRLSAR
jgi:hypothetical protein